MAKGWMSAKKFKIKKLKERRKGQSKRWKGEMPRWMKQTTKTPSPKVMYYRGEDGGKRVDADMSISGRNRVARSDPFLEHAFGKPALEFRKPEELITLVRQQNPRAVVLAKLIHGERQGHKEIEFAYKVLVQTDIVDFRLYMGGGIAFFISQKTVNGITTIRKSTEYGQMGTMSGLDRALAAMNTQTISWFTTKKIPATPVDPDTG